MEEVLRIENLKQHFISGKRLFSKGYAIKAVNGVSFSLNRGETLGLVGESGCGKSTLGRTILKLFEPTEGSIIFEGKDITSLNSKEMRPLRKEMQIVFQDPMESLNQRHTIGMILEEPFIIHGVGSTKERKEWVLELLDKVGLPRTSVNRYPHEFSGGQRQRIGIARAIALKPKLLICDESVSALDVSVQAQIINLLLKLQTEMNLAIIFISHDLSVVKQVSDNVAVMYFGEIVEYGSAMEVYNNPQNDYTKKLLSAIPITHPSQRKIR
ncbi:ABC transporter ATP-binding protein [Vibrio profundi]|uniref:ABC transporter ATP-binding protein n=1 Tax=Vibrio profundi TaxID=1774960 RepID=UPI003734CA5E